MKIKIGSYQISTSRKTFLKFKKDSMGAQNAGGTAQNPQDPRRTGSSSQSGNTHGGRRQDAGVSSPLSHAHEVQGPASRPLPHITPDPSSLDSQFWASYNNSAERKRIVDFGNLWGVDADTTWKNLKPPPANVETLPFGVNSTAPKIRIPPNPHRNRVRDNPNGEGFFKEKDVLDIKSKAFSLRSSFNYQKLPEPMEKEFAHHWMNYIRERETPEGISEPTGKGLRNLHERYVAEVQDKVIAREAPHRMDKWLPPDWNTHMGNRQQYASGSGT